MIKLTTPLKRDLQRGAPAELDSFPDRPRLSLPLDHPGLRGHLLAAATQIAYRVV